MIDVSTAAPASRVEPHLTPHPHREPQVRRFQVLKVAPTPFFSDYGCHVRILEEARALQAHGSDVVVYTYPVGRDPERLRVVRSLGLPGFVHARPGSSAHKLYLDGFLTLRAAREVAFARPNIVHGHLHEGALIGLPISRALRVPLIFDFQGSLTAEMIDHGFLPRTSRLCAPLRWLEGTINRAVDAVITSSRPAADFLVREFGCPASKIAAIPDGVDPEVFRPYWEYSEAERRAVREQLGVPPNRRVVVYLGLLAEYQGSSYLLRAAARVARERPDVHFLLMGYPGEERYRAMARGLGIADRVTCTGRVPYEAAPRFLAAGDVAVAPKLATTEANGKLLNYMALGLPTVAFDSPVNRDILGAAGIFARLADDEDLARKLLDVLDSEVEAASRGRSLRRRAEGEFSWSEAGRRILEVYAGRAARPRRSMALGRLWTPWRMPFIEGEKPKECIFCAKAAGHRDRENYVLYRGEHNFILLNTYPYTTGHLMIAPYAHVGSPEGLPPETTAEMMELTKRALRALRRAERAESFNVGMNIGAPAGAGIADHVHLHVVPRWQGDSNFMPVVGDVRLIPETLDTTYKKLIQAGIAAD